MRRSERGAALAEFAICLTLLSTLTFGAVEFGWGWKQRINLQAITRGGARVASGLGSSPYADREVLRSVLGGLSDLPGGVANVGSIVIYKATCTTCTDPYMTPRDVDVNCDVKSGTPPNAGVSGKCNIYFPNTGYFTASVLTGTSQWGSSASSSLDRFWTPSTRVVSTNGNGPDYVGIQINYTHRMIVGFFGRTLAMTDRSVYRLEPA